MFLRQHEISMSAEKQLCGLAIIDVIKLYKHKNMRDEIEAIVKAIESLQQESNPFKEYIFPIIMGFFSSILGAFVAYFTVKHNHRLQREKDRIHTINDWILLAEGAMQSLVSIKSNYNGKLSSNPFQRTLQIRALIHSTKELDKNISSLSFIIPKKGDTKALAKKWRQLPRIRAMVENYNFVIRLWDKRSEIERPLKEKIIKDNSEFAYAEVSPEQIFKSVNRSDFIVLIDLTERAIKFTDEFIIEFNDFITEFPEIGRSLIKKRYLDQYGTIINYEIKDNAALMALIKKTPEVDYKILAELFGVTVETVKKEYARHN